MSDTRGRRDKLIKERHHDMYRSAEKLPEPTVCSKCQAVFAGGRWCWDDASAEAHRTVCPACRRSADNYPAGQIEMKGEFFDAHRSEILNLVSNIEEQEKGERPLERIMAITDEKDHTVVTTTGIHIARRIGEALSRSYKGEYSFQYADGEKNIRVYWQR